MLRRLLREGVELELDHGADLWPVHADEAQLSNAIINLVVNARDAMPKGGTVTIRTANETVTTRRDARHRDHAGRRLCAHRSRRHRHRHREGASGQDLRSVLHHQAGRTGHRAGPRHRLRHRQADRRLHHRRQRGRQGHDVPHLSAALSRRRERAPVAPSPNAPARATSPVRTRSCWSKTKKRCAASRRARCKHARLQVLEASGGEEALEIVQEHQVADPSSHHRRGDAEHGRADAGARGQAPRAPRWR